MRPGDRVGPYQVIAPLKSGGMATLVLARRVGARGFTRLVAIKQVHDHLAGEPEMVRRFVDEARLASAIAHPGVVRVEDLVEHEGALCLVMEHVHGVTLGRLMDRLRHRDLRLRPEVAVALACSVAEALEAAHTAHDVEGRWLGLVHRDVSPGNVIVAASGHARLIDFGIASARVREHESTTGHVLGKLRYAAPEQLRRERIDARTDLYSLAVVLWELLTCEPCFQGGTDALDQARPAVPPPSRYAPDVSLALDRVVLSALSEDRGARPASARAMREALLESTPDATRIGAPEIATLLDAILGDELKQAAGELPREARTRPGLVSASALEKLTVSRRAPPPVVRSPSDGQRYEPRAPTPPSSARWATFVIVALGLALGVLGGLLLSR